MATVGAMALLLRIRSQRSRPRAGALAALLAAPALLAATGSEGPAEGKRALRVEELARGLEAPWSLAFLPDGSILVTERPGRVRVVRRGRLVAAPALRLRVAAVGEAGLLGIALHPRYPRPPFAYLYSTRGAGALRNRVSRFRVVRGGPAGLRLVGERVLLDGIPGGQIHDGGRIAFGPDGRLYVATGESGRPALAADRRSLGGKILRLRPDGRIPAGNPFRGSPVWSYGHRNVQGLAWDATGRLYASEHGPTGDFGLCCHDELNLIRPGRFYGWPLRAGRARAASPDEIGRSREPPSVRPVVESGQGTWAPSGVAFLGRSLFMATLRGEHLRRFDLDPRRPGRILRQGVALRGYGRLRDVVRGPDRCLYVLTSNRDGRGSPRSGDDRLLRLCLGARS